jgi:FAD/FMN-containing dehydrogenase/Fe-S oxidoreductase
MNLSKLESVLKDGIDGDVRLDDISRMLYSTDASVYEMDPLGVVLPRSVADVVTVVKAAADFEVSLTPRGAGTSLAGQAVGRSLHLDFSRHLNRILELNAAERWVRVEPGVVLDELNAFLSPYDLMFAPDVATSSRACVGGMIGNNSSGAHSLIYGKTIDHVAEVTAVLSDSSLVRFGPVNDAELTVKTSQGDLEGAVYRALRKQVATHADEIRARFPHVMRRVSGYNLDELLPSSGQPFDLSKIVIGSEGTLCVVVEARLKLVERPRQTALVACHFQDIVEALRANVEILGTDPSAVELTDRVLLDQTKNSIEHAPQRRFLKGDPEALLFVEYYGESREELEARADGLEDLLRTKGLGYACVRAFDSDQQKAMWELRKAGLGLLMGMRGDPKPTSGVEDTCVPVESLPEYVTRVRALMAEHEVVAQMYGHASVGVLHIRPILNMKEPRGVQLLRLFAEKMSDMVLEYGGSMSAEHGDGLARSEWIQKMFGPRIAAAFAEVKAVFDPDGIMNPGKIVDAPMMDENLRYGGEYRTREVETHFSFDREGGFQQAAEMCSGIGHCRKKLVGTMCPSYMATLEEEHSTRGRANALRAALTGGLKGGLVGEELHQVMDLCLECKACKAECPSSVDMAKLKYEFLAHYGEAHGYSLRARLFGHIDRLNRWMSPVAPVANWLARNPVNRWLIDRLLGIDRRRHLPALASQTFSSWFDKRTHKRGGTRGQVVLFNDTFTEYNEPQIGMAATFILESAGFEVLLPTRRLCCGRPMISKGFLKEAKQRARENVEELAPYAAKGLPIVGLEPSCILTFRDDYLDLLGNDSKARAVADRVFMLEDFLVSLKEENRLSIAFTDTRRRVLVHGHCHQRALVGIGATLEILGMPPNFEVEEIPSGCCGMAGSFGYEKEHYDISMKVGEERLFKAVRSAGEDVVIAAVGTSCRHQIADATGKRARHWAEILVEAL